MNFLQKTLATTAILIIFGVLIFVFIIQPTIVDIKTFNERIELERIALENKYTNRRNVKNIIADLKNVENKIAPIEKQMITPKGNEVKFITHLESVANKNDLTQKLSLSPQNSSNNFANKYGLSLNISGNYINLLKYLNDLERSQYYIIIDEMDITSSRAPGEALASGNIKANLQGYAYFSK